MARTYRNENVINNKRSNKAFKKESNKKMRVRNANKISVGLYDSLVDSVREVSNFWTSEKEWKKYVVK